MRPTEANAIEVADAQIMKRAIAYYRSSSEHQSEHPISLQQAQVQSWAANHGIEIIREFSDVGKSGSMGEERPAFDEMIEDLGKRSDIGYVVCVDASRLSRFEDDVRYIQLNDQSKKHGKQLICTGVAELLGDDSL